jgi:hypothetical protein
MRRIFIALSALGLSATLVGCSAFYPNWGATGLPEEPEVSVSEQATAQPEPTETSETAEPEPTQSEEPESTAEPEVELKQVQVDIIMAIPEPDFGVLTVVAQIPGIAEAGGICKMRFIGSDKEVTMEVRAEPSSDYTQCFPIEFPLSDLPSGNGIVTVSYESGAHFGLSPASSVVIP